ncbi:thioesterase family protein [Undibacterium nitidum]|nr:thioesterase family protein [Undibacterium nitidum]
MNYESMVDQATRAELVDIAAGWGQGRATFGGLLGALVVAHLQGALARKSEPGSQVSLVLRALTISFVAPVEVGQVSISSEVLRSGKSVTQMLCTMKQNGQVCVSALASFGAARQSRVVVASAAAPQIDSPEAGRVIPNLEGIAPEFTKLIDFRFINGELPFSGAATSHIEGWMRWKPSAGVKTPTARYLDLVALIDAWPPAVLQMLAQPTPSSSLTWTLEFPAIDDAQLSTEANPWWQYRAVTESAQNGYAHISSHCWDQTGRLVAISRQTATVFA